MGLSERCKQHGLESVAELSRMCGKARNVLYSYEKKFPQLLRCIILGAAVIKKMDGKK